MTSDRLLVLLRSFSKTEMRQFTDFVGSPYFNKRKQLTDFWGHLSCFYPEFDKSCLGLEVMPGHLLGKKTKKELSYIKSELYRLAKQFIGIQAIQEEPYLLDYYTAQCFVEKGNPRSINQLKKLKKELDQYEKPRLQEMLLQFWVLESLRTLLGAEAKDGEMLLQESIDALERYYLVNKVSQSWEIQNRRVTVYLKDGFSNPLMSAIENYLNNKDVLDPQVAIYFQLYLANKHLGEAVYFDELLRLIRIHYNKIDRKDLRDIYLATINTSVRNMRVDREKYTITTLELYMDGIKSKVLFEKEMLSPWTYNNVTKLGVRLKRFSWVKDFIEEYQMFLTEEERLNAFHTNSAELAFAQKAYDLTFEHLKEVNMKQLKYYLATQMLYVKVFYETNNIESCLHTLAALKSFLSRRKEVAKVLRKSYQNFANILFRILMIGSSEKKRVKIGEDLKATRRVTEKEWLLSVYKRESKRMYV